MTELFKSLTNDNWITIAGIIVTVLLAGVGGIIAFFRKKDSTSISEGSIHQEGTGNRAVITDENTGDIAGGDIHKGIDGDKALDLLITVSKEAGQSGNEVVHLQEEVESHKATISQLEKELSQKQMVVDTTGQEIPQPTQEAKELATLITEDDGLYAQALKAIAEGNNVQADELLDEAQQYLDTIQEEKDKAQIKILMARISNYYYSGKYVDALPWCEQLEPMAGNDLLILKTLGAVYYKNAMYKTAEPLLQRVLLIDEKLLGEDHPIVARDLNNLAQIYKARKYLPKAEPLMHRALAIVEKKLEAKHPDVAGALNNLAQLYVAMDRLSDAEPLMHRSLAIAEASLGKKHPKVAVVLNNLAQLYQATDRSIEAEPLMERSVKILENPGGEPLPHYESTLNNLAQLYKKSNRLSDAESIQKKALNFFEDRLGPTHPDTITARENLEALMGEGEAL